MRRALPLFLRRVTIAWPSGRGKFDKGMRSRSRPNRRSERTSRPYLRSYLVAPQLIKIEAGSPRSTWWPGSDVVMRPRP